LKRKRATAVALHLLSAIALLVLAAVILGIIFFFAYAIVWFGYNYGVSAVSELIFSKRQHISHHAILIICWCFLALLFLTNARVGRDYWISGAVSKSQWSSLWLAGVAGSLVALLVNADASAKTITDLMLTGPRLMSASVQALRGALFLLRADLRACADALALLAGRASSVSTADLSEVPGCSAPQKILAQLLALDTVLLLRAEPITVTLNPDLRDRLQRLSAGSAESRFQYRPPARPVAASPLERSPYEVLGLSTSASLEEIRAAYRRKVKGCHPDLFARHSDDVRHRAEEKTKTIIAAYEELLARYHNERKEEVTS
jgi:hypothetical protein